MIQNNQLRSYKWLQELPKNTALVHYLEELNDKFFNDSFYEQYRNRIEPCKEGEHRPFLTVLIRTQGKREEGLRESLLCVLAQSFTDYEIILIGHKVDSKNKQVIKEILQDQQEEFREKIRYVELDEGSRTTPLNVGFSLARGQYVSVFDDDDILFDNWAYGFYRMAKNNAGKILHTYAFMQNWQNVEGLGYRANSKPKAIYCYDFELPRQLVNNRCPLMTLAFPTQFFQEFGVTFNEELDVMEDWEYFMRLSLVAGVADLAEPTAIYRFWDNIETSATLHNQDDWDKALSEIQKSFGKRGLYFPEKYTDYMINVLKKEYGQEIAMKDGEKCLLYYSKGAPFSEDMVSVSRNEGNSPEFNVWFAIPRKTNKIKALRFDLTEDGLYMLKRVNIELYFANGDCKEIDFKECVHSGYRFYDNILFLHEDPEIVWQLDDERMLECVHVSGVISRRIPRGVLKWGLLRGILSPRMMSRRRKLHKKGWF